MDQTTPSAEKDTEFDLTADEFCHVQDVVLRLKQKPMGELLGVSQTCISYWRRGLREVGSLGEKSLAWELAKQGIDLAEVLTEYREQQSQTEQEAA